MPMPPLTSTPANRSEPPLRGENNCTDEAFASSMPATTKTESTLIPGADPVTCGGENSAPLSIEALFERFRGKAAVVEQVLHEFQREAVDDLKSLANGLEANDAKKIGLVAHALKGAAGLVCAEALHGALVELEHSARFDGLDGAAECFVRVKKAVEECLAYLSLTDVRAQVRNR